MDYQEQLVKRVQEELDGYFQAVRKFDRDAIENELFIIKSFKWSRQNQEVPEDPRGAF